MISIWFKIWSWIEFDHFQNDQTNGWLWEDEILLDLNGIPVVLSVLVSSSDRTFHIRLLISRFLLCNLLSSVFMKHCLFQQHPWGWPHLRRCSRLLHIGCGSCSLGPSSRCSHHPQYQYSIALHFQWELSSVQRLLPPFFSLLPSTNPSYFNICWAWAPLLLLTTSMMIGGIAFEALLPSSKWYCGKTKIEKGILVR